MRLPAILRPCAALLMLASCGNFATCGPVSVPPLPPSLAADCARPESIAPGPYRRMVGDLGVALIDCGASKAAVVADDQAMRALIGVGTPK